MSALSWLHQLVALDTRNPPRAIGEPGLLALVRDALGTSFEHELMDLGSGCLSLYSQRGTPRLLFNFHIDTVPVG